MKTILTRPQIHIIRETTPFKTKKTPLCFCNYNVSGELIDELLILFIRVPFEIPSYKLVTADNGGVLSENNESLDLVWMS